MTDKPNTLALDPTEWRTMLAHNLTRAIEFVQKNEMIAPEGVKAFHDHLDRMKALTSAWHLSQPAGATDAANQQAQGAQPVASQANGAAPVKRGGWPKGKPRVRKQPTQVVQ